jgi:hypothetical protein
MNIIILRQILGEKFWAQEVIATDSRSCPTVGFGINSAEVFGCATTYRVEKLKSQNWRKFSSLFQIAGYVNLLDKTEISQQLFYMLKKELVWRYVR